MQRRKPSHAENAYQIFFTYARRYAEAYLRHIVALCIFCLTFGCSRFVLPAQFVHVLFSCLILFTFCSGHYSENK